MDKIIKGFQATPQDLEQINKLTRREFNADELYTFSVILCDNQVDRDFERFDNDALTTIAQLFIGKTGIFDHETKSKNQAARIYDTEVVTEDDYTCVKGKVYMVKSNKNSDIILDIDGGIKKEVSISCNVTSAICSICGADAKKTSCSHKKGKSYKNELCYHILGGVMDAYEWSLVAVPAQKNAGVTKNFDVEGVKKTMRDTETLVKSFASGDEQTLSAVEAIGIFEYINALEKSAKLGEYYRNDLIKEVCRLSFLTSETIPANIISSVAQKLDINELKAYKKAYEAKISNHEVQLKKADSSSNNTHEFKM